MIDKIGLFLYNSSSFFNHYKNKGLDMSKELFEAIAARETNKVHELLASGVNPNAVDSDGNTPLHYAVGQKNIDAIRLLIESGACINTQNDYGYTPLHNLVAVKLKMDAYTNTVQSIMNMMIFSKADINIQENHTGKTVADMAMKNGFLSILQSSLKDTESTLAINRLYARDNESKPSLFGWLPHNLMLTLDNTKNRSIRRNG